MSLAEEICVLFAGVRGFIDKYPVSRIREYENKILDYLKSRYPDVLQEIEEKKEISVELERKMKEIYAGFDKEFAAESES